MKKDASSQEKKIQILEATTRLLTYKGLQNFSFEAVATEAGLSRQLIRYYYADLDALITDLCDYLGRGYQEALIAGIVKVGQVERLDFFLDFFFGVSEEFPMPDNLEAYDALFAYAVGHEPLKERLCDKYKTLGQVIQQEIAIAHPEIAGPACDELAFLFVSMMHAHWSYIATLGFSSQYNRVARDGFDRLIKSYVANPPTKSAIERPWARENT